ncbi:MAG: hypothetical protein CVV05_01615 [Gammaproteobacteria bacterium HGW-Gammaproteobacteria-1]|jgi:hypothetical protein|nr:MAG: hypothetical protein CVV05_01615 [Gammaproteobacteria bacterium HGW-Gammaproteobacteria-1]
MDSALITITQGSKHGNVAIWSLADGRPSGLGREICESLRDVVLYPVFTGSNLRHIRDLLPDYRFVVEGELPLVLIHRLMALRDREFTQPYQHRGEERNFSFNPAIGNLRVYAGEAVERANADVLYRIAFRETELAPLGGPAKRAAHRGPGTVLVPSRPWITIQWSGGPVEFEGWPEEWLDNPASKDE